MDSEEPEREDDRFLMEDAADAERWQFLNLFQNIGFAYSNSQTMRNAVTVHPHATRCINLVRGLDWIARARLVGNGNETCADD